MPLKASKYAISVLVYECTHELQIAQLTWVILLLVLNLLVSNLCYKLLLIVNSNLSQQWRFLALSLLMRAPFINDVGCSLKKLTKGYIIVVQSLSRVWLFVAPWTAECQASLSFSISQSLLKLMSIESVTPSIHFILCYPLLLLSIFPIIRVFSNELALLIRWPKYWSFNFNISSSNEYSGLISFRIDWFDVLTVQGTLKCLLQHHSSNIVK